WLPEEKNWSMMLNEPDHGSDPETGDGRPALPGRRFATHVAFRMILDGVESAFWTEVQEPKEVQQEVEVYRPTCVKAIARNQDVGLVQGFKLQDAPITLNNKEKLRNFNKYWKDPKHHLPMIVMAEYLPTPDSKSDLSSKQILEQSPSGGTARIETHGSLPKIDPGAKILDCLNNIGRYRMGFAQYFILPYNMIPTANKLGLDIKEGDFCMFEPQHVNKRMTRVTKEEIEKDQDAFLANYDERVGNYPMNLKVKYGNCIFVYQARDMRIDRILRKASSSEESTQKLQKEISLGQEEQDHKLQAKEGEIKDLQSRNSRLQGEIETLRKEKSEAGKPFEQRIEKLKSQLERKQEVIQWLWTRFERPKDFSEIADWAKERFDGRLILHKRAEDQLKKLPPDRLDIQVLCDCLDFLASEYRDNWLAKIDKDQLNDLCDEKYGRRFEVTMVTGNSLTIYRNDYYIKYPLAGSPSKENPLDHHLKIGVKPKDLLRIYFLRDKTQKIIVVGSLPDHLPTG
ncbi:MAG: hypothetical protein LBR25_09970, partial [Erysipelotrichaceae bacterium]|nr:hypothetical protein [Erysipelotrichaceae bacterium]